GRSGRAAIAPEKVARALAIAAGAREWRGGAQGFTDAWQSALMKLASLAEQAALKRLFGDQWRDPAAAAKAGALSGAPRARDGKAGSPAKARPDAPADDGKAR